MTGAGTLCTVDSSLASIASRLLGQVPDGRRALVAVDGVDGSGKTTFAGELARVVPRPVVLIHLDRFLNPRVVRYRRGRTSPEGFWLDSYDYTAIIRDVLEPLGREGSGWYREACHDLATDSPLDPPPLRAPEDAVVIVEGLFLHRDELARFWDFSIFLDVPFSETARRMAQRDGTDPDPEHPSMRRYVEGQRLYFAAAEPWTRATVVVDNARPDRRRVVDGLGEATVPRLVH